LQKRAVSQGACSFDSDTYEQLLRYGCGTQIYLTTCCSTTSTRRRRTQIARARTEM
jgi:hypothetical protein